MEKISPEMEAFIHASCTRTLRKLRSHGVAENEAMLEIALNIENNPELYAKFLEFNQVRDSGNGKSASLRSEEFDRRRPTVPYSPPSAGYEQPMEVWKRSLQAVNEHVWRGNGHASGGGARHVS